MNPDSQSSLRIRITGSRQDGYRGPLRKRKIAVAIFLGPSPLWQRELLDSDPARERLEYTPVAQHSARALVRQEARPGQGASFGHVGPRSNSEQFVLVGESAVRTRNRLAPLTGPHRNLSMTTVCRLASDHAPHARLLMTASVVAVLVFVPAVARGQNTGAPSTTALPLPGVAAPAPVSDDERARLLDQIRKLGQREKHAGDNEVVSHMRFHHSHPAARVTVHTNHKAENRQ